MEIEAERVGPPEAATTDDPGPAAEESLVVAADTVQRASVWTVSINRGPNSWFALGVPAKPHGFGSSISAIDNSKQTHIM
jgi:hypothetical protein